MLDVTPLAETFAAEVHGVDLSRSRPPEAAAYLAADLLDALVRHQVLLFRNQDIDGQGQLAALALFGEPSPPWTRSHIHPQYPLLEVFEQSPPREYRRPSEHWHSDASFLPCPTDVTMLRALAAPAEGGQTMFTDMRTTLAQLPGALRARIEGMHAVHDFSAQFVALRTASGRVDAQAAGRERAQFPPVTHPLVRKHPVTGVPALYLNELCLDRIEGLTPEKSTDLLARLYRHALSPKRRYEHSWREGDVLVWDNPSLLHRGTAVPEGQRRLLHRCTAAYREAGQ